MKTAQHPLVALLISSLLVANSTFALGGGEQPGPLPQHFLYEIRLLGKETDLKPVSSPLILQKGSIAEEKSVFKAVLLSLVLPGLGELYSGEFGAGKYFLIAESGLWLTFASFELYGRWLRSDARQFAARHASASIQGKDDQFFVNLGNFNNVYDYNEKKLRDRDLGRVYDPTGPYYWWWDSERSRVRFRELRVKSDKVLNNVRFVAGAIIVNHLASAINAARLVVRHNKDVSPESWRIESELLGASSWVDGVRLTFRKDF